jgi:hypothetical protein
MRVKLFWQNEPMKPGALLGFNPTGKNAQGFETEINAWLQNDPKIKIVDIKQSASGGRFIVANLGVVRGRPLI